MDVTLVLTHGRNLACFSGYTGEHDVRRMDDETLDAALDLLFSDDAPTAKLSFFGGEPFLAFDAMQRAVAGARERARRADRRLLLQCTTNGTRIGPHQIAFLKETGMRVTVSIDNIEGLYDDARPREEGGGSSSADVEQVLRALVDDGLSPDVTMSISPESVHILLRSVRHLFSLGVRGVRAALSLQRRWSQAAKEELHDALVAVGRQVLWHRLRGEEVVFSPFDEAPPASRPDSIAPFPRQVVVGTRGHLYPCSPMVGEDQDRGPEASLRIGHLDDGLAMIHERVAKDGAGCGGGRSCACAAYQETGDRRTLGPNVRWFARVAADIGAAITAALVGVRYPDEPFLPVTAPLLDV